MDAQSKEDDVPRIKITDLPHDSAIGREEMKRIKGGITFSPVSIFPKVELDGKGGDILSTEPLIQNDIIFTGMKI